MATPIKRDGRVMQYLGRILRRPANESVGLWLSGYKCWTPEGNNHTSILLEPNVTYYHSDGTTKDIIPNPFVEGISQTSTKDASGTTFNFDFTLKATPSVNAPEANPSLNNKTGAWPSQLYQLVAMVKDGKGGAAVATAAFPVAPEGGILETGNSKLGKEMIIQVVIKFKFQTSSFLESDRKNLFGNRT
jgi:hypothetical protein